MAFQPETDTLSTILRVRDITKSGYWLWAGIYYITYAAAGIIPLVTAGCVFTGAPVLVTGVLSLTESGLILAIFWLDPRAVAARYDKAFTFFAWLARAYLVIDPDDPATKIQIKYFLYRGIQLTQQSEALAIFEGLYGPGAPAMPAFETLTSRAGDRIAPPAD